MVDVKDMNIYYEEITTQESTTFSITDLRQGGNTEEGGMAKWRINRSGNLNGTSQVRFNTYEVKNWIARLLGTQSTELMQARTM